MILEKLAYGYSFDQIKYDYDITVEDIKEAILYSYKIVANEEILEVA